MRKPMLLLTVVGLCLSLTACGPQRSGGPLLGRVDFETAPKAGTCTPTPGSYQDPAFSFTLPNRGRSGIIVEQIQPRESQNLRISTNYLIGPALPEVEPLATTVPAAPPSGWRALQHTSIPAGATYQFTVAAHVIEPSATASLRDFVITYTYRGQTFQAATGYSYRIATTCEG